ncbi:LEM domain-containing protein 1 isoform X3 [Poecilia formosa]|uniref:LEM domain-containing protein 1 isoform X3 n=1 Tax=Poecilia formosa TaxID=48698 RepID=UPI0007BA50BE|nr:PREDICTED: lamina-associated polypeptide 2, isoforms beta/gamma-like isoform X3 [Poecilia formosa]
MSFVQYPAHLSKSRLKSDLVAHNVELPPAGSKKEAYVALHLRHVDQTNAANFSSDDDDQEDVVAGGDPESAEELDPSALTDNDLKALLFKYGVKAGPILASTRAVYENKLRKLLQSAEEGESNEAENAVLYSDSDEEDVSEENEDEEKELVGAQEKKAEALEPNQQQSNEKNVPAQKGDFSYPQCFFLSSRLRPCPPRNNERSSKRNSKNALKSSERTRPHRSQIPAGIRKVSSVAQHSGLRSGDPGRDILKDLLPDTKTSPTGIYASPRRPIKGAAQRPIQYAYPDTPVSPTTLERREVQRRLVPVYIQVLVFFAVVCILFLIFVNVEDTNGVVDLLESLNQCPDGEDETRDAACGEL